MKLNFLVRNIKRDLKLIPTWEIDKVSIHDVNTVIERWEQALQDEHTLKESEQRFQELLNKEPFLRPDFTEAMNLLMFIHRPLIEGRNDVMGVRLRDADYLRLHNRVTKLPVETGIAEFNRTVMQFEREERERKRKRKRKLKEKATNETCIEIEGL